MSKGETKLLCAVLTLPLVLLENLVFPTLKIPFEIVHCKGVLKGIYISLTLYHLSI